MDRSGGEAPVGRVSAPPGHAVAARLAAPLFALLAVLGLAGCAAPQSAALRSAWQAAQSVPQRTASDGVMTGATAGGIAAVDAGATVNAAAATGITANDAAAVGRLPPAVRLDAVPFVAQNEFQCGPAALAMAMRWLGRDVPLDELTAAVYLPARQGSLAAEMLALPRRHGLLPLKTAPRLQSVLALLAEGRPVIVFQNLGLSTLPVWHYAVLIGYDLPGNRVLLHSATTPTMAMSLDTFERTWARSGYWAMTISEPAAPPAGADPAALLQAAVALERLDRAAALQAYEALLARHPGDRLALLARANVLYAGGRLADAVAGYRRLLAQHPDAADGWNNLAQALAEQGRRKEARQAVDRALALGGPRLAVYQQTAAQLNDRTRP